MDASTLFRILIIFGFIYGMFKLKNYLKVKASTNSSPKIYNLPTNGGYDLEIVGEASFQDNLLAICGRKTKNGHNKKTIAYLILEDTNPVDKNAVRIDAEGKTVGYLSRAVAIKYRDYLKHYQLTNIIGTCPAVIKGGWERDNGDSGHFGVWLDFTL